jgi:outer membrane receptor protein involved in Fe transport
MVLRPISLLLAGSLLAAVPLFPQQSPSAPDAVALSLDSLLDTKVSAAAKYAQTSRDAGASITIVTSDDIARYGYRTLADVLAGVRGFYLSDDYAAIGLGTRGFSPPGDFNNRVLLLLNGHPVNDDVWGQAPIMGHLAIDLTSLERVEVIRGPGSALYGAGAMFAVINLVTKTGQAVDGIRVGASGGSLGRYGMSLLAGGTRGGLDYMVSGMWENTGGGDLYFPEFDSPATNNGIARNLDWEHRYGGMATATVGPFSLAARLGARSHGFGGWSNGSSGGRRSW